MHKPFTAYFEIVKYVNADESLSIHVATFWDAYDADIFASKNGCVVERVEYCNHGMSAWLCEDPISHYGRY